MIAALVAGVLLAEWLLRWLLFSPAELARRFGEPLREPGRYVAAPYSDDFNKLGALFLPEGFRHRPLQYGDAETGWLKATIELGTYRHAEEGELAGRRPVLLYGTSFARCKRPEDPCFEELLEASELGRRFRVLNYAVQGHGLDQTLLLLRRSVERFAALDPVVVVAFVVEADLERTTLSFFTRPKPRFVEHGEGFVLERPDELEVQAYLERHPPAIRSYLWRSLVTGLVALETRQRWEGEPARVARRDALTAFLLQELAGECRARELEHFVLLFHVKRALAAGPGELERALLAQLERAGLPWVDTRATVEAARASRGSTLDELYEPTDEHPSARGTAVLFEALARGLSGERDGGGR